MVYRKSLWKTVLSVVGFVGFLFISFTSTYAQGKPKGVGGGGPIPGINVNPNGPTIQRGPDSTIYKFIYVTDQYEEYNVSDTALDMDFLHSNAIDRDNNLQINLGNRASASMPLRYKPSVNVSWNAGYQAYELYDYSLENFKFYNGNRPMTQLYFSQLGTQQNLNVGADFSSQFKDGLSIALNYDRVAYNGYFADQGIYSTHFGFGIRYSPPKSRYQSFLVYLRNANEEKHNGGLVDIGSLPNLSFPILASLNLSGAASRYQNQNFAYVQYFRLHSKAAKKWSLELCNEIMYKPSYYKYSDKTTNTRKDSLIYGEFINDGRGLRSYLKVNQFTLGTYLLGHNTKEWSGRLGVVYDYFDVNNTPHTMQRHDITAVLNGRVPLFQKLAIDTKVLFGFGNNAGNFDVSGRMVIDVFKRNRLLAGVRIFNGEANYQQKFLVVNGQQVVANEFDKMFGTSFNGTIEIPSLNTRFELIQHIVNNPVYREVSGNSIQSSNILAVTYASAQIQIPIWKFRLDNQVHWQIQSNRLYPLPRFYGSHQFYFQSYLFRNALQIKTGLDLRWIERYEGPKFFPLLQDFGLSQNVNPNLPFARYFIMGKVARFRVSFSMENILRYIHSQKYNYYVENYALFPPQLNMTIGWIIND
jgi:hypothetical protein